MLLELPLASLVADKQTANNSTPNPKKNKELIRN